MFRILLAISLFTGLAGCDNSVKNTKPMDSDDLQSTFTVDSNDLEMEAAMQIARNRFPEFWQEVSADYRRLIPAIGRPMVKAYFYDEDAPMRGEHMCLDQVDFDGTMISATLADIPHNLPDLVPGQRLSFPLGRLSDWIYIDGERAIGAFTINLLRSKMSEEERKAHDRKFPFQFE